ncbi:MAG: ABC transporter permease [Gemmatimonadaceae bacterium]|nr:ABC transporter permease [Gemmatimonadaceae bacterium]
MTPFTDWWVRLRGALVAALAGVLAGARRDREHVDEAQFHLEMSAARFERQGVPRDEAWRRARLAFGGAQQVREQARDARGGEPFATVARDVRYALRQLQHSPGFALAAVITLALGIGANTALFSVFDGVLRRPLPFPAADRLVIVWETDRVSGTTREPGSWPDYVDFAAESRTMASMAAFTGLESNFTPARGEPQRLATMAVTHGYFALMGVGTLHGRSMAATDDVPGAAPVVVLGERFWRARFGGNPAVVGTTIRLDDAPRQVIGIVPAGADFAVDQVHARAAYHGPYSGVGDVDAWIPMQASEASYPRDTHPFFMVGRLSDRASLATASDEFTRVAARLEKDYRSNTGRGVLLESLEDVVFAPVRPVIYLLLAAVALVLLVACVNVANLLLARGAARAREVAVRAALGASFSRLGQQFLVESLLLSMVGGTLGVALAWAALRALIPFLPSDVPRVDAVQIDAPVLLATLATSVLVGLAFGLLPTWQALKVDVNDTLKGEGRGTSHGVTRRRLREGLVVGELAMSVMLVLCAGLMLRSVWSVLRVDPGFDADGVLKAEFTLPAARYPQDIKRFPDWPATHAFTREVLQRVRGIPGVEAAAIASSHPLDAGFTNSFVVVGREAEARNWPEISVRQVTPGYLATMHGTLRRGRSLGDGDDARAPLVAVINEAAARRYFEGRDPLGQDIRFWGITRRIVGVVGDEHVRGPAEVAPPAVYASVAQAPVVSGALLVRSTRSLSELAPQVQRVIWAVDPQLAIHGVEPLRETLQASLGSRRFTTVVLGAFAALTLLLALVGIHGVLSYSTSQRRREIGIRLALGATRGDAAGLVVRGGVWLAATGTALGLLGAAAASRLVTGLLFGVTRSDPVTYLAVATLVLVASVVAMTIPALRAARVAPTEALRLE